MLFLILTLVVCSSLSVGLWYIIQPAWTFGSSGMLWFLAIIGGIFSIGLTLYVFKRDKELIVMGIPCLSTLGIIIIISIISLVGSPIFNAAPYREIANVEEGVFEDDFEDVLISEETEFLDLDTARHLGDRVLGSVPNAPWYNVNDEYNLIVYQGRQYRVSPLEYRDFLAYFRAVGFGIPGYVLVDVATKEATFVKTEPIRFSPSGLFGQKLSRHLRGQFPSMVFDQSFMEIDEEGTPYWVTATLKPNAGLWGAQSINGLVLTNACTGESTWYSLEEKPVWVDHVCSLEYMMSRTAWHYSYVHGWWNASRTDVFNLTYAYRKDASPASKDSPAEPAFYGYASVVMNDEIYVITGITPANRTESNVGFLLISCADGRVRYYSIPGAEESSAQSVAEGLIQHMGYEATFPVMVNVAGEPIYMMALKDKSGLIQKYALVNYKNYSQSVVESSLEEAIKSYLKLNGVQQTSPYPENSNTLNETTGSITERYQAEIDGTTVYYYIIDGELYRASIKINEAQVLFKVGDVVVISYHDGEIRQVVDIKKE